MGTDGGDHGQVDQGVRDTMKSPLKTVWRIVHKCVTYLCVTIAKLSVASATWMTCGGKGNGNA